MPLVCSFDDLSLLETMYLYDTLPGEQIRSQFQIFEPKYFNIYLNEQQLVMLDSDKENTHYYFWEYLFKGG